MGAYGAWMVGVEVIMGDEGDTKNNGVDEAEANWIDGYGWFRGRVLGLVGGIADAPGI